MRPLPLQQVSTALCSTVATCLLVLLCLAHASNALGSITPAQRAEQVRYSWETASLPYEQFLERKANFTTAGCNKDEPKKWSCASRKPAPYDSFTWTTDGCSGKWYLGRSVYRSLFDGPCQQHDFAYRNIGKGVTTDRSNSARSRIDDQLRDEAKRVCKQKYSSRWRFANRQACFKQADGMRSYFRSRFAENWDAPCGSACVRPTVRTVVVVPPLQDPLPLADTSGGHAGGTGGDGTPPPPPAVAGITETAGGVTNTWTNPANAGGTKGPSIAAGQSVVIACRLTGFQVANGNTWWYRIASAPWNGNFYASADAFYNNGATSGTLLGTPYVDTAVPLCAGSPPAPPQPAPTWGETAGGVANTWTNPANAGGAQGPSVARGQTIRISCRLQGFRVANGNTWWYRIAQSPWNNQYFVSADAFYNNGATSGSLLGTPYVDTAVAPC